MAVRDCRKSAVEQDAWRGALSRSTEEFLRNKAFDRAWSELRKWQEEYPIDKVEGYLTLLQARYWAARSRWPQAIALAGDLVAINPDSPYADRLVYLAAQCEEKQGHADRARAGYQSLLTDYPGSPLVGEAKKKLAAAGQESRPVAGGQAVGRRVLLEELPMNDHDFKYAILLMRGLSVAARPGRSDLARAGDLVVDLGKAADVSLVGAIQRWDEDGKPRVPGRSQGQDRQTPASMPGL